MNMDGKIVSIYVVIRFLLQQERPFPGVQLVGRGAKIAAMRENNKGGKNVASGKKGTDIGKDAPSLPSLHALFGTFRKHDADGKENGS